MPAPDTVAPSTANERDESAAFRQAFVLLHELEAPFPRLVLDFLRYRVQSVDLVAAAASRSAARTVTASHVRSCLHGRVAPDRHVRAALTDALSFDPWTAVDAPNIPVVRREIDALVRLAHDEHVDGLEFPPPVGGRDATRRPRTSR